MKEDKERTRDGHNSSSDRSRVLIEPKSAESCSCRPYEFQKVDNYINREISKFETVGERVDKVA